MLSIYFFRCFFYCCMCVCVVKMDLILVGRYFAFVSRQLINGYENPEMPSLYSSLTTHKHSIFYSVYAFRFELSLTAMIAQYISFAFVIFFCFVFFFFIFCTLFKHNWLVFVCNRFRYFCRCFPQSMNCIGLASFVQAQQIFRSHSQCVCNIPRINVITLYILYFAPTPLYECDVYATKTIRQRISNWRIHNEIVNVVV